MFIKKLNLNFYMIIKTIELVNIRSYKFQKISLETGINFFSGDIGSGKSSILLAIEFCLFGFKKGDLEAFQLLRKGELKGSVKLVLENNDKRVEITRNLQKSNSSGVINQKNGSVNIDGNLTEMSANELTGFVFNLLGFPIEFLTKDKNLIYRFTTYTPQEQLKEILFAENDKRLEVIRKIFKIDKYKQLRDAISIYLSKIREQKSVFFSKLESFEKIILDIKVLDKEIIEINSKLEIISEKEKLNKLNLEKLNLKQDKRDEVIEKIRKNILTLEKHKTQFEEIRKQKEKISSNLEILKKEINENNIDNINEKREVSEIKIRVFNDKILKYEKDILDLKKEIDFEKEFIDKKEVFMNKINDFINLEKNLKSKKDSFDIVLTKCKIKDLENLILSNEKKLKKFEKIHKEIENVNLDINNKKSDLKLIDFKIYESIKKSENLTDNHICDKCFQEVDENHLKKVKEDLKKEIFENNKKKDDVLKLILDYEKKLEILKKDLEDFNSVTENKIKFSEKMKFLSEVFEKEKKVSDEIKLEEEKLIKFDFKLIENNLEIVKKNLEEISNKKVLSNDLVFKKEICIKELNELKIVLEKLKSFEKEIELKKKSFDDFILEMKNIDEKLKKENSVLDKLDDFKLKENDLSKKRISDKELILKVQNNLNIISQKLTEILTIKKNKEENLEKLREEESKLKQIKISFEKIILLENLISERVVKISSEIERQVFTKFYVEFNEEFEEIFHELIEDNNIDVRLSDDFSPIIEQNGFDIDLKNLSGGEKSSLAIAYRLGLKKTIETNLNSKNKLSLLILDEPTDGLSQDQVQRFGNLLKSSKINQIIIVSHDEKLESISDNMLKITKQNHESKIEVNNQKEEIFY